MRPVVPVIVAASAAGGTPIEWRLTAYAGIFALDFYWMTSECGRHGGFPDIDSLLLF
jgi:hypothetical protein